MTATVVTQTENATQKPTLNAPSVEKALREFEEAIKAGEIDREMLPYLARLNALPNVQTLDCCTGHMSFLEPFHYRDISNAEAELNAKNIDPESDRWGYVQLMIDEETWDAIIGEHLDEPLGELIYNDGIFSLSTLGIESQTMDSYYEPPWFMLGDDGGMFIAIGLVWAGRDCAKVCEKICKVFEEYSQQGTKNQHADAISTL